MKRTERRFVVIILEEDIGEGYKKYLREDVAMAIADYFAIDEDISFSVVEDD